MEAGEVEALFILGGNPVYNGAGRLEVRPRRSAGSSSRPGSATTRTRPRPLCDWHLPESHELEAWGDVRATDGTATIQQPLIAPLYNTSRSASELIAALLRHPDRTGHEIVRATWKEQTPPGSGLRDVLEDLGP